MSSAVQDAPSPAGTDEIVRPSKGKENESLRRTSFSAAVTKPSLFEIADAGPETASSYSDPALPDAVNKAANKLSIGQRTSGDVGGSSPQQLQSDNTSYSDPAIPDALDSAARKLSTGQRESGDVSGSSRGNLKSLASNYKDPLFPGRGATKKIQRAASNVDTGSVGQKAKSGFRDTKKKASRAADEAALNVKDATDINASKSAKSIGKQLQRAGDDAGDAVQDAASSVQGKILRRISTGGPQLSPVIDNIAASSGSLQKDNINYSDPAIPGALDAAARKLSTGQRESGDVGGSSPNQLQSDNKSYSDPAIPSALSDAANKLSIGQRVSGDVGGSSPGELQSQAGSYSDPVLSNRAGDKISDAVSNVKDSTSSGIDVPDVGGALKGAGDKVSGAASDAGDKVSGAASDAKGGLGGIFRRTSAAVADNPVVDNIAASSGSLQKDNKSYNDPAIPGALDAAAEKGSRGQRGSGDVGGSSPEQLQSDNKSYSDPAIPSALSDAANKLSIGQRVSGDVGGSSPGELQKTAEGYTDPLKIVVPGGGEALSNN